MNFETHTDSSQNVSGDSTLVKVRCPECMKLYSVDINQVSELRPRFQCRDCQTRFWVAFAEAIESGGEVLGLPLEWLPVAEQPKTSEQPKPVEHVTAVAEPTITVEPHEAFAQTPSELQQVVVSSSIADATATPAPIKPAKPTADEIAIRQNSLSSIMQDRVFSCPKCAEPYGAGQDECTKCGVVFMRFKERSKDSDAISATPELKQLWDRALDRFDEYSLHQIFIRAAYMQQNLDYAALKYGQILQACPHDAIAQQAQKEIVVLAATPLENLKTTSINEATQSSMKNWLSTVDIVIRKLRFTSLIMLMCGIVIGMGILLPHQRNLVGIGTAVLFFILALRYYFRII